MDFRTLRKVKPCGRKQNYKGEIPMVEKYTAFEEFKEATKKYVELLNLKNWRIYFKFEKLKDNITELEVNFNTHVASIVFSSNAPLEQIPDVDILARYVCLKILLCSLRDKALHGNIDMRLFDSESDSIIRVLEKLL